MVRKIASIILITIILLISLSLSFAENRMNDNQTRGYYNCPICNYSYEVKCRGYLRTVYNQECFNNYPNCYYDYLVNSHYAFCNQCNRIIGSGDHKHYENKHSKCAIIDGRNVCYYPI